MFTSSEYYQPLEQPQPLFPSSPLLGCAGEFEVSALHLPSQSRSFSPSPPHEYDSEAGYFGKAASLDDEPARYSRAKYTAGPDEIFDASLMAQQYLDFPTHYHDFSTHYHDTHHETAYSRSESSTSSPAPCDTTSSSSPRTGIFSTQSSPGYRSNDLPETFANARADFTLPRHPLSHHYDEAYGYYSSHENVMLPAISFQQPESSMHQRSLNNWSPGYSVPSLLPSISLNSRIPMSRPSSPASSAFGQFPVGDDLQLWPHMFKMTEGRKAASKK
ncbi:hypothetical protein C8R46DRAFT_1197840 [Mycena filopes]|nr:hypothetical protein C8R46DRAFT_1197840 [Mycena filopes]